LKNREKATDELSKECKDKKAKNDEMKLEIVIKTRHLKERENVVQKKEVEYKNIVSEKRDLEQRRSKQEYKERKWQSNVAQINSAHAAAIEEVEGYLKEQIEVACTFEEDLKKTRAAGELLKKENRVLSSKLDNTQEKYEEVLYVAKPGARSEATRHNSRRFAPLALLASLGASGTIDSSCLHRFVQRAVYHRALIANSLHQQQVLSPGQGRQPRWKLRRVGHREQTRQQRRKQKTGRYQSVVNRQIVAGEKRRSIPQRFR